MCHKSPKVVISGGSHSGKTTLLSALRAKGYKTVPEVALLVIEDLIDQLGVEGQATWRKTNPHLFQVMIAEKQLALEAATVDHNSTVFFDRGLLDGVAYCSFSQVAVPEVLASTQLRERYTHVFILETITPFMQRAETGRIGSEAGSRRISELLFDTYTTYGYSPSWIEHMPLEDRIDFVLKTLGSPDP